MTLGAIAILGLSMATERPADAEVNSIDAGAYDLDLLLKQPRTAGKTQDFYRAIEGYRITAGGKFARGDLFVLFPNGGVLHGANAKKYVTDPKNPLQTIAYAGMPCSEYGSAAVALAAMKANRKDALRKARSNKVFRQALQAVVAGNRNLRKPAAALNIEHQGLWKALVKHAKTNPTFERALSTLVTEVSAPVATVINGFGVPPYTEKPNAVNEAGQKNYYKGIRASNRSGKAFKDPVDLKVAGLLFARFKRMADGMGINKALAGDLPADARQRLVSRISAKLRSPELKLLVGGSLTGHCAGAANAANTTQVLADLLGKQRKTFPAGELFLGAMSVVGYGAVYNVPRQVTRRKFFLGDIDQFGALNSIPAAVARDTSIVSGAHMMNPVNADTLNKRPQLRMRATNEVFGVDPFKALASAGRAARPVNQRLFDLQRAALRQAKHYRRMALRDQTTADQLARDSGKIQKLMPTYDVVSGKLKSQVKVNTAQAERYEALAGALEARRLGNQAARRGDASEVARQRAVRGDKIKLATARSKQAARQQESEIGRVRIGQMWSAMTGDLSPLLEYGYIHNAKPKEMMTRLGENEMGQRSKSSGKVQRAVRRQLLRSQYHSSLAQLQHAWRMIAANSDPKRLRKGLEANLAALRQTWATLPDEQKREMIGALRRAHRQLRALERRGGGLTPRQKEQLRLSIQPIRYQLRASEFAEKLITIKEDLKQIGNPHQLQQQIAAKEANLGGSMANKAALDEILGLKASLAKVKTERRAYLDKVRQQGQIRAEGKQVHLIGTAARYAIGLQAIGSMRQALTQNGAKMKPEDRVKVRKEIVKTIGKVKQWRGALRDAGFLRQPAARPAQARAAQARAAQARAPR